MDHPRDLLALKFAHDNYFYLGLGPQMRDSIGRVWSKWDESVPLYGYVYEQNAPLYKRISLLHVKFLHGCPCLSRRIFLFIYILEGTK